MTITSYYNLNPKGMKLIRDVEVGGRLKNIPEESWAIVQKEKHPNMLHLLQFPYNGEPPKGLVTAHDVTPNPLHFIRNHGGQVHP